MNPTGLTLAEVHRRANEFLKTYNPSGILPVPIEKIVELRIHIALVVVPGIKDLLGIDAFISSDFSQITVDEYAYEHYPERTKFSIAHEIGHAQLHTEWYKNNGPKNLDDYLTFHERISNETYKYLEIQANTFAGLVLVPTHQLTSLLKTKLGRIPSYEDISILLPIFQELLDVFRVSGEMLLYRLQKEKIVKSTY